MGLQVDENDPCGGGVEYKLDGERFCTPEEYEDARKIQYEQEQEEKGYPRPLLTEYMPKPSKAAMTMTMMTTMMTKEMKKMTTTMKILYIVRDREFQREQIVAMINMTLKREMVQDVMTMMTIVMKKMNVGDQMLTV